MAKFFIDRPVFAWVIAIVLMLAGLLSIHTMSVAQYPNIAPPSIAISVSYPGASAQTVQDAVVQVIEQQMNGIDHLEYMYSESNGDGTMTITLTFAQGTNPDIAQVQVQNKLALAQPLLPQEVQQQGLRVTKATKNFLIVAGFISNNGSMDRADLADYTASYIQDPISRTQGVGDFTLFGSSYAMRIWLEPTKLVAYNLTAIDVSNAIAAQNVQISSGQLGQQPALPGQQLAATVVGPSRLNTPDQFGNILLKVNPDGSRVFLRDVARIELGAQAYNIDTTFNGQPAAGLAIKLSPGANALDTVQNVRNTINRLKPFFPPGMDVVYPYDTTPFVKLSIDDVVQTLIEAIILVFLVMYLFLQNIRATLVPTLAVPVVLLGAFAVLNAFGFTINTLTMFGMVLAIGLLVDDAIVVVENVERVMHEEHLTPLQATRKSMEQITGALIGIAMVLAAVFIPMAFFGGSTGVIYRQFSITIVSSMALSVLVAIVFTPALCATILQPPSHAPRRGFFGWFNRNFERASNGYGSTVSRLLGKVKRVYLIYVLILLGMVYLFAHIPTSFLPEEDQGILFAQVSAPPGATTERTRSSANQAINYLLNQEKDVVDAAFLVTGFNFGGRGQSAAIMFIKLKDWKERNSPSMRAGAIAARLNAVFARDIHDAQIAVFAPPAVMELGNATGFDFMLEDQAGLGHETLLAARNQLLAEAMRDPKLMAVRPNGIEDAAQYKLNIDREKAEALGVSISDLDNVLSIAWGSSYVNDFIDRGRVKKVFLMSDASGRMLPQDLDKWYVRNASGGMVPFSAFASGTWQFGPEKLNRYNGVPAFEIQGLPAPGYSSGDAMAEMEHIAAKLPKGIGYEWTGLSYEEQAAGQQAPALYAISLIVVFLCLAALYESWSIPTAVMLVVPLGVVGALLATMLRGLSNDVYFQVGLLTTVGLAAKNAILVVEFAKEHFEQGGSLAEAAIHAARQRLRPILMTSMAFILGVLPLALSHGAGSGSQNAIGTGVIGGMLTGTFLVIFFVPTFFVTVLKWFKVTRISERVDKHAKPDTSQPSTETTPGGHS